MYLGLFSRFPGAPGTALICHEKKEEMYRHETQRRPCLNPVATSPTLGKLPLTQMYIYKLYVLLYMPCRGLILPSCQTYAPPASAFHRSGRNNVNPYSIQILPPISSRSDAPAPPSSRRQVYTLHFKAIHVCASTHSSRILDTAGNTLHHAKKSRTATMIAVRSILMLTT